MIRPPSFFDSLKNKTVQWKKADVFNPAAIVKNDSIYVLSVARIIRQRHWAEELPASEYPLAWMEFILLHTVNQFFILQKMNFSNMIIPEDAKIRALYKQKMVYMYLPILPGITKFPGYP